MDGTPHAPDDAGDPPDEESPSTTSQIPGDTLREDSAERSPGTQVQPRRRSLLKAVSVVPFAWPLARRPHPGSGGASGSDDSIDDLEEGDEVAISDAIRLPESYRMEVVPVDEDDPFATVSGRVHGTDQYMRTEHPDGITETYLVDGTAYVLSDEEEEGAVVCSEYPAEAPDSRGDHGRPARSVRGQPEPRVELIGTTIMDDRETFVFESLSRPPCLPEPAEEAREGHAKGEAVDRQMAQPGVTYFVDAETGYLRRLQTESVATDYVSWGDVELITPPDMECSEPEFSA